MDGMTWGVSAETEERTGTDPGYSIVRGWTEEEAAVGMEQCSGGIRNLGESEVC